MQLDVDYGRLEDVFGRPCAYRSWTFMPARIWLSGGGANLEQRLVDQAPNPAPATLKAAFQGDYDAAWVRARLPRLFGYGPLPHDQGGSLLYEGFVAARTNDDGARAVPFRCTDYYGRTGLVFSEPGPPQQVRDAVAQAFWGLLLDDPAALDDFEDRIYHPGADVWLAYACKAGAITLTESPHAAL